MLDIYDRRIVGWSLSDHLRAELIVDALEITRWRRWPRWGATVLHSDRGSQYTSWAFGHRLREAGILGSMGRVGSAYDNATMESFFSTLQRELLDRRSWTTREELAGAIFEWIEAWYNPRRRHPLIAYHSSVEHERAVHRRGACGMMRQEDNPSGKPGEAHRHVRRYDALPGGASEDDHGPNLCHGRRRLWTNDSDAARARWA